MLNISKYIVDFNIFDKEENKNITLFFTEVQYNWF